MIKYVPSMTSVVLEEIPGKVSLALAISNCRGTCPACHSPFLRKNIGAELNYSVIDEVLDANFGVNCFLFLGEGRDLSSLLDLAKYIREKYQLDIALYSGRDEVEEEIFQYFDYVKLGPYRASAGPLNSPSTNQRLYKIHRSEATLIKEDITHLFWRKASVA